MKNALNWFEIPATDLKRAQAFYEHILDAKMEIQEMKELNMTMAVFPSEWSGDGVGGSIASGEGFTPSAEGSTIYLNTGNDLSPCLARVENAGGQILVPKTSIGESGFIAMFLDTEGNRVGLHSPN